MGEGIKGIMKELMGGNGKVESFKTSHQFRVARLSVSICPLKPGQWAKNPRPIPHDFFYNASFK